MPPLDQLFFLEAQPQSTPLIPQGIVAIVELMCGTHSLAIGTHHQFRIFDTIQLDRTSQTFRLDNAIHGNGFPGFFGSPKGHGNTRRDFNLHGYHPSSTDGNVLRIQVARKSAIVEIITAAVGIVAVQVGGPTAGTHETPNGLSLLRWQRLMRRPGQLRLLC